MLTKRQFLIGTASALAAAPFAAPAFAAEPPVFIHRGAAIRGYDPVAYFKLGAPTEGTAEFSHDWNGATWRFASEDHRAAFAADPDAFAPQFGGYCAWAVAEGYTASTVPEAWKIVDGKLYMNFSKRVQRRWERDIPGNIARGNANWPQVLA